MTDTTTAQATQILDIPAEGLTHTAGPVIVRCFQTPQAGILVQVRRDGVISPADCTQHRLTSTAIREYERVVAEHPAEVAAPAVKLAPAARGTQTHMTPAEAGLILAVLTAGTAHIGRGRGDHKASIDSLKAMARRGFVQLAGPPFRPTGARITSWGALTAVRHDEQRAAARQRTARLTAVLAA